MERAGVEGRGRHRTVRGSAELAEEVIGRSDRLHPADAVLRQLLRDEPGVRREVAADVARRVFGYFRWCGVLDAGKPLSARIGEALGRVEAFAREPEGFSDAALEGVVPAWIRDHLAVTPAWLRSLQTEPRLWVRARPGTAGTLALELGDAFAPYPEEVPDAVWYRGTEDLFRTPAFQEGRLELQDLSSQAVGLLCRPAPGESWWDACCGEGGKTLHLADQMTNRGVVWATDRAEWRLRRLRMRTARAGLFNVRWAAWDGRSRPPVARGLHGVLVDAPCSGVGTWQRNPHARWTLEPGDVEELAEVQLGLLRRAAPQVRVGGSLVYAVCTLTRLETTAVARAFGDEAANFEPVPVEAPWQAGGSESRPNEGWMLPEDRAGNGMFVARWRRVS